MMQTSGVDAAIHELERDVKRVQDVIKLLKKIRAERALSGSGNSSKPRRLSPQARRRISQAAKKRWAAARASKN
jgi:hypothetical protein